MNKLEDLEVRKVVERNDLLTSLSKLDATPIKLFELAVSCIDDTAEQVNNVVTLSKKDIYKLFEASAVNDSFRMEKSVKGLQSQTISITKEVKPGKFNIISISPIPTVIWTSYDDNVKLKFNEDLMPYLLDLKSNFTQYSIIELQGLKSRYSLILYKYLISQNNQYQHYKYTNKRTKQQLEDLQNPYLDIKQIRELTDTVNEYQRFDGFETRVLKKAKEEINKHTNLVISYEKVKQGRRYRGIKFYVTRKNVAKRVDSDIQPQKKLTEEEEGTLYTRSTTSKYTKFLTDTYLLGMDDITDKDTMINLILVYQKYADLEKMIGVEGVKKHLAYVFDKQNRQVKTNIVKYLDKAITDYLVKVKLEQIQ